MSSILRPLGHWYQLPGANYYYYAACTVLNEDARFYDPSPLANMHGDAICTIDCLLPQKNAILPLFLINPNQEVNLCESYIGGTDGFPNGTMYPCSDGLLSPVDRMLNLGIIFCTPQDFTNAQAVNWMARVQIYNVTWARYLANPSESPDFSIPSGRYDPTNSPSTDLGGSLYRPDNTAVYDWRNYYAGHVVTFPLDPLANIMQTCTDALDVYSQQPTLNKCRNAYYNSLHTTLVGPQGAITIPAPGAPLTSLYYISFMVHDCQYVLDISDTSSCPMLDDMCKNGGMVGNWRFSFSKLDPAARISELPKHLCQNLSDGYGSNSGRDWVGPPVDKSTPNNQYLAGLGRQPTTGLQPTVAPQSTSAAIYRSCELEEYTACPEFCCANDFADGDGGSIFNPMAGQVPGQYQVNVHRSPVIGYDYDAQTPWYGSCFDRNGLTCDPKYRDITGTDCQPALSDHCALNPLNSGVESWALDGTGECTRWLGRLLYGPQGAWIDFMTAIMNRGTLRDPAGSKLGSKVLFNITTNFHQVFTMKNLFDDSLSDLGKVMEPVIFTLYKNYNLNLYDHNQIQDQCSIYTIDDVIKHPLLRKWCGCMLNSESYGARYPKVSIACTPTCNSIDVLQYGAPCTGTLCIIDNVTIDLIDSKASAAKAVSISQVCQSCGQIYASDTVNVRQTCECQITDVSGTFIDSILGTISVNEFCTKSGNGSGTGAGPPEQPASQRISEASKVVGQTFPYTILALVVTVAVLALIAYIVSRGIKTNLPYLWATGLTITVLIMLGAIILGVIYAIAVLSKA
jgi:hypothetical protein